MSGPLEASLTADAGVTVSTCSDCGTSWYLPRDLCPECGSPRSDERRAHRRGRLVAVTRDGAVSDVPVTRENASIGLVMLASPRVLVMGLVIDDSAPGDRVVVEAEGGGVAARATIRRP